MADSRSRFANTIVWLQEFSIPLIVGVVAAMGLANLDPEFYGSLIHTPVHHLFGFGAEASAHEAHAGHSLNHFLTLHFLVNDIFMVLFFGIAAKEITEACLPGGSLSPFSKALNPLIGTLGGVVGPVAVYLGLNAAFGSPAWTNGWGIPTATDIALAWLVAKLIFGRNHPAVSFLLLLAVADDAIGLGIIAIAYPDPEHPAMWANALWIVPGMLAAFFLRLANVRHWAPYILTGGTLCWWGLFSAHLHPALALVFIVPFLPGPKRDLGLYRDLVVDDATSHAAHQHASPLEQFEHFWRTPVDFGLFFFAFANAGVSLGEVNGLTWLVLASLIIGKTIGITAFCCIAQKCGLALPNGLTIRDLIVISTIAGLGLTVALFVSGQAFADAALQGAASMGAVLSAGAALLAFLVADLLGVRKTGRSVFKWLASLRGSSSSRVGELEPTTTSVSMDEPEPAPEEPELVGVSD